MLLIVLLASLAFSESTTFHDLSHEELVNRSISLRSPFASTASANDLYGLSYAEAVSFLVTFTGELLKPFFKGACCLPQVKFQMTSWGRLDCTQYLLQARPSSVYTSCSTFKFHFFTRSNSDVRVHFDSRRDHLPLLLRAIKATTHSRLNNCFNFLYLNI